MTRSAKTMLALGLLASFFGAQSIRTEGEMDELASDISQLTIDAEDEVSGQPSGWKGCCFDPLETIKKRGEPAPGGGEFANLAPAVCCVCGDGQVRVGANWKCNVCKSSKRKGVACAHKLTDLEEKNANLQQGDGLCKTDFWTSMGLLVNDQGKKIKLTAAQTEPCNRLCEKHLACTKPNCKASCPTGEALGKDNIEKMNDDFEGVVSDIVEDIGNDEDNLAQQELDLEKQLKDERDRMELDHIMEDTLMVDHTDNESAKTLEHFPEQVKHISEIFSGDDESTTTGDAGSMEDQARDHMMTDTLDGQEKIDLEIHDQGAELMDLEKDAIEHHEPQNVVDQIKNLEKEDRNVGLKQDALVGDIEESLDFLDSSGANNIEALSLEEAISEDMDVLRQEKEQLQNLKDVHGDLTDRNEQNEVSAEFNKEKELAKQQAEIIEKEKELATNEDLVNDGSPKGNKGQIIKDEQVIQKLEDKLAIDNAQEHLEEDVTMDLLKENHQDIGKLIEDANEVLDDGLGLEFDMEDAISDAEVLFTDDKSALKTGGKVGGELGDPHEQALKAENKFQEDEDELIQHHSVEDLVEEQVKKGC